jgi:hypothetical protein
LMVRLFSVKKLSEGEKALRTAKREQTDAVKARTETRTRQILQAGDQAGEEGSSTAKRARKPGEAGRISSRDNLERSGKGVIDRFSFKAEDYTRTRTAPRNEGVKGEREETCVGPESGLPIPEPDPRYNPPLPRDTRIRSETATWTGVVQEAGRLEFSRVNKDGNQEWLSAIEVEPREWKITTSKTTAERRSR